MILTRFDLFQYRLPLVAALKLKGALLVERKGLLVRLANPTGAVGWGEVSPLPGFSRESLEEARQQLLELRESLLGWAITPDWVEREGAFVHHVDAHKLVPSVRFGLELAVWNLFAAARGRMLSHLVAQQPRTTVSLNGLLLGASDEILVKARRLREAGFRAVKLKVGRRAVEEEVELVRALSWVLEPDVRLRIDANRAWSLDEAGAFVRGVTGMAIEYIEEPLADPKLLPDLVAQYEVPIALDETLLDVTVEGLVRHKYARAVILKPTLLGGLVPTLRMADRAMALGMTPVLSASFETGIGLQGLVALAAGLGPHDIPVGLDTYRWLADDVFNPRLELSQGQIDVPVMLNTRRTVDEQFLQAIEC